MSATLLWHDFVLLSLVAGCLTDVSQRRLPNELCVAIWAGGVLRSLQLAGTAGGVAALQASALAFACMLALYVLRAVAAGDVKYFAALTTFLPPASVVPATVTAITFGGLLALATIGWESLSSSPSRAWRLGGGGWGLYTLFERGRGSQCGDDAQSRPAARGATVPYAVALSFGVWMLYLYPSLYR